LPRIKFNPKKAIMKQAVKIEEWEKEQVKRFERIPTEIYPSAEEASLAVANEIIELIKEKKKKKQMAVLGLATGSTPIRVYEELVKAHKKGEVSFSNVITFNLDEYYPIAKDSLQSYYRFMHEHLFDHIDIDPKNIHIPDGTVSKDKIQRFCLDYEQKIQKAGGIDLQVLGIGRTGHIGFNEPGSPENSITRIVTLDHLTRTDAASDFFSEENVPRTAISMGIGTILQSKKILLMAWGEGKAQIIKATVEGAISDLVPATCLQKHSNVKIILDNASSDELTRIKTPWLVQTCAWNTPLIRQAVVWLSEHLNKPILKLTDKDYNENGMSGLISEYDHAYEINILVFNILQHTITGWPGGKPKADDSQRPERAKPFPKRVVIFSPHPDDDVISMGGTLIRLVDQKHEVHVAYQTSGNIAVFDDDVVRFADFMNDHNHMFDLNKAESEKVFKQTLSYLKNKKSGQIDVAEILKIKGLIRKGEAKAACRYCGIHTDRIHFMDMPFYETGLIKKNPIGEKDIKLIMDLLNKVKPHQVFAAGDLSDPHGTHRMCLHAIFQALKRLKKESWMKDCYIWLYRGAWQEWKVSEIDMAVPLSPEELLRKRKAVFKHQSQKDQALFPGSDSREFWQRAEERNRNTAATYDKLGLAEYEAMEAFVRYIP